MHRLIAILLIGILTLGVSQANGQSLKDLMKKKKENTEETTDEKKENKAENAVRQGINKGLDKLFGTSSDDEKTEEAGETEDVQESSSSKSSDNDFSSKTSASGIGMNAIMSGLGITGSVNVKDVYKFDAYIEMTITNYDSDGKADDPGKYTTYLDADSPDYGISFTDEEQQDGEMTMIFDTENSLMLTLMESDGEKTGFAVAFTEDQQAAIDDYEEEELEEAEANPYNLKKTGKTKKILGYKCEEYKTEDENSIIRMWVTEDLEKKISKTFMKNAQFGAMFTYAYFTKGFVMETVTEDKDDHEKSVMTVTDIDVDKVTSIKTGGYTIMNMGAMEGIMGDEEEE